MKTVMMRDAGGWTNDCVSVYEEGFDGGSAAV